MAGDRDGRDGGGEPYAGDRIIAAQESRGKGSVESVASGGRIDGFHLVRRDMRTLAAALRDVTTAVAELEQHVVTAQLQELLRRVFDFFGAKFRCASLQQRQRLGFVWRQPIDAGEERRGQRTRWSGIEHQWNIFASR